MAHERQDKAPQSARPGRANRLSQDPGSRAESNGLAEGPVSSAIRGLQRQAGNRAVVGLLSTQPVPAPADKGGRPRSLAVRDRIRAGRSVVQRDITDPLTVKDGTFNPNLKTTKDGGNVGLMGTISFKPSAASPDSNLIKLLQVVKVTQTSTGTDYTWTGPEAGRMNAMTTADATTGVTGGYFVDHSAAMAKARTAKADARVSPYYRSYWPNPDDSNDGYKKGDKVRKARLWDFPGASFQATFDFETAAKAADTGYIYGTFTWGFTIDDVAKGTVKDEYSAAHRGPSSTFLAAVAKFDEAYKNPGATGAP